MKLSMTNNPVIEKRKRIRILEKREKRLEPYASVGNVLYANDTATRFYPNLYQRQPKARKLLREVRKEKAELKEWLKEYNYLPC